jgi:ribonuclease HI
MNKPTVIIYCDGACSPNPGVGGWAAILISPAHQGARREIFGAEAGSTNNRMELTAAIKALDTLKWPCAVQLTTDSEYLKKAFTEGWLAKWQRNGWRTASRQPVANVDLWAELARLAAIHSVSWRWVRGHADDELNTRCDVLAVQARESLAQTLSKQQQA